MSWSESIVTFFLRPLVTQSDHAAQYKRAEVPSPPVRTNKKRILRLASICVLFPFGAERRSLSRPILFYHARNNDVFVGLLEVTLNHSETLIRSLYTYIFSLFLSLPLSPFANEIASLRPITKPSFKIIIESIRFARLMGMLVGFLSFTIILPREKNAALALHQRGKRENKRMGKSPANNFVVCCRAWLRPMMRAPSPEG